MEVIGHIHEHFINAVHMDVFRCNIFQINLINPDTVVHVKCHAWRRDDEVDPDVLVLVQHVFIIGSGRSIPATVQFLYLLLYLEEPWTAWYAPPF